jgi:hypothetical protein
MNPKLPLLLHILLPKTTFMFITGMRKSGALVYDHPRKIGSAASGSAAIVKSDNNKRSSNRLSGYPLYFVAAHMYLVPAHYSGCPHICVFSGCPLYCLPTVFSGCPSYIR